MTKQEWATLWTYLAESYPREKKNLTEATFARWMGALGSLPFDEVKDALDESMRKSPTFLPSLPEVLNVLDPELTEADRAYLGIMRQQLVQATDGDRRKLMASSIQDAFGTMITRRLINDVAERKQLATGKQREALQSSEPEESPF